MGATALNSGGVPSEIVVCVEACAAFTGLGADEAAFAADPNTLAIDVASADGTALSADKSESSVERDQSVFLSFVVYDRETLL